jgi:hypothetical protein
MPLVFGGAPVVNTFFTITTRGQWGEINPFFWAGLILVVAGSVMVLVLAPRGEKSQEPRVKSQEPEVEGGRGKREGGTLPDTTPS